MRNIINRNYVVEGNITILIKQITKERFLNLDNNPCASCLIQMMCIEEFLGEVSVPDDYVLTTCISIRYCKGAKKYIKGKFHENKKKNT